MVVTAMMSVQEVLGQAWRLRERCVSVRAPRLISARVAQLQSGKAVSQGVVLPDNNVPDESQALAFAELAPLARETFRQAEAAA